MNASERKRSEDLVREVLRKIAPHDERAKRLLAIPDLRKVDRKDIEVICRFLLDELTATGIDKDSEPTRRGIEIEAAIDWVRALVPVPPGPAPR